MLGKILLTLAVIAVAYLFVRQGQMAESNESEASPRQNPEAKDRYGKEEMAKDFRLAAYLFLIFMTGIGGALYYFRWQDDHTVLTVNLHRENQAQPVSYRVYKYQLQDRSFITLDGTQVTVASSERMEVLGSP